MSYADLDRRITKPNGFRLYKPANASTARRLAQRRYEEAIDRVASADAVSYPERLAEVERARRNYGFVLLREDRLLRPHIYEK